MAKIISPNISAPVDENVQLKTAMRLQIEELEATNQRMSERRLRIEKLKSETRAILNQLKVAS